MSNPARLYSLVATLTMPKSGGAMSVATFHSYRGGTGSLESFIVDVTEKAFAQNPGHQLAGPVAVLEIPLDVVRHLIALNEAVAK